MYLINFIIFVPLVGQLLVHKLLYCSLRMSTFVNFWSKCALPHFLLLNLFSYECGLVIIIKCIAFILCQSVIIAVVIYQ